MKRECANCRRWTREDGSKFGRCAFHSQARAKVIRFETRFHETAFCTAWAPHLLQLIGERLKNFFANKYGGDNGE